MSWFNARSPKSWIKVSDLCIYLEIRSLAIRMCYLTDMVLQRGLFFEISYGRALFDARARKELFANAQVNYLLPCFRTMS